MEPKTKAVRICVRHNLPNVIFSPSIPVWLKKERNTSRSKDQKNLKVLLSSLHNLPPTSRSSKYSKGRATKSGLPMKFSSIFKQFYKLPGFQSRIHKLRRKFFHWANLTSRPPLSSLLFCSRTLVHSNFLEQLWRNIRI